MGRLIVRELRAERDLLWHFSTGEAFFIVPRCAEPVRVDPFPGYAHDADRVRSELAGVAASFPVKQDVTVWLLDREDVARTNAFTEISAVNGEWSAQIVLSGKRTPIFPAVTRAVLPHEFGHVVAKFLSWCRGEDDTATSMREYRARWRPEAQVSVIYGGGAWHEHIEEVFADDFRVLVAGRETDFWPHPGIPRPEDVPGLAEFWAEQRDASLRSMGQPAGAGAS